MMRWTTSRNGWRRGAAALIGALMLGALPGCGGSSDDSDGQVRLVNASTGYTSMDLYVDSDKVSAAVGYGEASEYFGTTAGTHTTAFHSEGSATAILTQSRSLAKDTPVTLITYGWSGGLAALALTDTEDAAASGKAKLLVVNTAADAGSVDVYLSGTSDDIADATAVAYSVAGGSSYSGGYVAVNSGTYRLRVTAAGSTTDVRLDIDGLTLNSTQVASLVITPTTGGVLVNGLLVAQGGTVTALNNTQARVRVVSGVNDGGAITATFAGTTVASASTAPAIGNYAQLTAGNGTLALSGTSTSATQTFTAGGDYTVLVLGTASAPTMTVLSDDNRLPTSSTQAKLRVLHGLSDDTSALTLSADYSAVAQNVAQGSASAYGTLTAATLSSLMVYSSAGTLYSDTDVTLAAKGVYTVFMLGTTSQPLHVLRKER